MGDVDAVQRSLLAHGAVKAQIDRLKFQEGAALVTAVEELREAGRGASIIAPRCDSCGTSFDLPLD